MLNRYYTHEKVENPVRTLIEEVYEEVQLQEQLQLQGTIIFESLINLLQPSKMSMTKWNTRWS